MKHDEGIGERKRFEGTTVQRFAICGSTGSVLCDTTEKP